MRFLSELRTYARNFYHQRKGVHPPHPPNYPRLQHSQVNDPTRPCKKSQTANQLSSTREDLGSNFIRQTIIWKVDYNSFFDRYSLRWRHQYITILKVKYSFCSYFPRKIFVYTYSLRWRHQYITIFKVKYSFCSYSSRKNFVHLDFSLKRSVTRVLHVTIKSSDIFASIFSFEFLNIITK